MPETDQQPDAQATDQNADQQTADAATDDATDWKAKAREWEKRAKQNTARIAELEPKVKEYDKWAAASKSDLERAQEQATNLQRELETTQRQALVASVALDKGLPANLARRLQGDSREDLETDADELLAQFPQQSNEPRAPRVDRSQGSSANGNAASADPAQQFASILRGQLGS